MPPLLGFSDNLFQTRDDVLLAATSLLGALTPYKSPCGARIKLSTATGTGFDEIAAQLEGFARPLWVVADLLALMPDTPESDPTCSHLNLKSWVRGLQAGTDPNSNTYWGDVGDHDQRMVEMEPIAYGLLCAPLVFLQGDHDIDQRQRNMILAWLRSINERVVPPSNWRWFRILVNLALVKSLGVPYHEVKSIIDADFEVLDSFYISDGWSSDGLWSADKKQADYYSGSFAMQYSQLAYVRFAHDLDPERVQRYRTEAGKFAETFWRYFDVDGAAIPFGRSLTYRFTFAAFWSAVAVSDVPLPSPLNQLGIIKGLLMRHLRWWAKQGDIFNTNGTLNIGYTYPNMFMSEDYNSPQSVYWCLKTFSVLGLPQDHPFWTCEELPHPLHHPSLPSVLDDQRIKSSEPTKLDTLGIITPPMHITCSTIEHHFLLSAGQFTKKTHRAREAKYGKFAYSSAFAFSVPAGTSLAQMAPDSTLSISNDSGETWRARWEPIDARVQTVRLSLHSDMNSEIQTKILPTLVSAWRPWNFSDICIETILVPPLERWPGWHVRIHNVVWGDGQVFPSIQLVDAGFAISNQSSSGNRIQKLSFITRSPKVQNIDDGVQTNETSSEGTWCEDSGCLILSKAGASGIFELSTMNGNIFNKNDPSKHIHQGSILQPDSNTNLISQRTVIPVMHHQFDMSSSGEAFFTTGIFAIAPSALLTPARIAELWQNKPNLTVDEYMDLC